MLKRKRLGVTTKIFIGLILGLITGIALYAMPDSGFKSDVVINGLFYLVGQAFLRSILMMVVPLVFISLVNGSAGMGDVKKLGRIGIRTIAFYLVTTAVAISIAITLASFVNPGVGLDLSDIVQSEPTINETIPLVEVLLDMIPRNPIAAMSNGNMLQIVVFAVFMGIGLSSMGEKSKHITIIFEVLNDLMMKMVGFVMMLAPYGVFALIARTFATEGFDVMIPLLKYMLTVVAALAIHAVITYGGMLKAFTGLSAIKLLKNLGPALSVAFSTASSGATLPVTMDTAEKDLGVSKSIAAFTLPLGATINMDGTAIMQGVATIFIAQVYGIDLSFSAILTVILTATLASIGTAGVPGVGLVMLSMVLQSVGLPIEGIALIMGIDRTLDMARTAINITGDTVCTVIIARAEGEFDEDTFYSNGRTTTTTTNTNIA